MKNGMDLDDLDDLIDKLGEESEKHFREAVRKGGEIT